MTVIKEIERFEPLYTAKLENGVMIENFGRYGRGSDGKTYYHIGVEHDDMLETVGWSCEIDAPLTVEKEFVDR